MPDHPAGPFAAVDEYSESDKVRLTDAIRQAPAALRNAVAGLSNSQLDTPYHNWTIRQITHHLADSHLHSVIRFKWALTEDNPTIKAYEEADWVQLADCRCGDVGPALELLHGLHAKWVQILESMTADQYARTFLHPQTGETVSLWKALNYYAWHSRHHAAQIVWLCEHGGWK
ncbi:MAG: putative metal-dependent hydrolase [Planctomycetaceae bacterium]